MSESQPYNQQQHEQEQAQVDWTVLDPQLSSPEKPDFIKNITRLEAMARDGITTAEGIQNYEFRAGIEVEFQLADPQKFDQVVANTKTNYQKSTLLGSALDLRYREEPPIIEQHSPEEAALKSEVEAFVRNLQPTSEEEEQTKQEWLAQVPEFTRGDLVNFRLYREFSNPALSIGKLDGLASRNQIDAFEKEQGWLEFRFGKGELQTGYYDNPGMSELRLSPCPPAEATVRREKILSRLAEIAGEHGMLVVTTANQEHVNLSVYRNDLEADDAQPVIGNQDMLRKQTVDVTSGIMAGFQDGAWLSAYDMQFDYRFSPHHIDELEVAPTRKSLRVLEGRLELRTRFDDASQALNWMMAGAIAGLAKGSEGLSAEGYQAADETEVYQVHRTEAFDKQTDIQIQRAFESSDYNGQGFTIGVGWNIIRGNDLCQSLLGKADMPGWDVYNELVFQSIRVSDEGVPVVDQNALAQNMQSKSQQSTFMKEVVDKLPICDADTVSQLNARLATVRLSPATVVKGAVKYQTSSQAETVSRLRESPAAHLAYADTLPDYVNWLAAVKAKNVSKDEDWQV